MSDEDHEDLDSDDEDYEDFDSGPFCRHWVPAGDNCEEKCATCGHTCSEHDRSDGECLVDGCDCKCFVDVDEGED